MEDTLTKTDRAKPAEPADGGDAKVKRDKRYLKRFLAILLFAAVLIGAYVPVRDAVNFKYDVYDNVVDRKHQFLNLPENSVDVLLMGASAVHYDLHPAVMYRETGLRNFNLGTFLQPPAAVLWNLRETLKVHHPDYMVIDFSSLVENPDPSDSYWEASYAKGYADLQDENLKKGYLETIRKYYPDTDMKVFTIPFYRYHGRWRDLGKSDFIKYSNFREAFMGCKFGVKTKDITGLVPVYKKKNLTAEPDPTSVAIYDEVIELCRENDIRVIMILPPRLRMSEQIRGVFRDYAEAHDFYFIDYNDPAIRYQAGFELATDFIDENHLNTYGARKMTAHLARVLADDLGIQSEPYPEADQRFEEWTEAYYDLEISQKSVQHVPVED